jgi:hypothetical protein
VCDVSLPHGVIVSVMSARGAPAPFVVTRSTCLNGRVYAAPWRGRLDHDPSFLFPKNAETAPGGMKTPLNQDNQ